jgi:hypothetical protein
VLADGSAVDRRRQGVAGDLEGVTGKVPGKEERTQAHRNGRSTVRRCQRRRATALIGGEGALVVAGGGDEVLQLGRGEGVRDLQEISGLIAQGGAHRGLADGGGARPKSARERGLPVAGGGGPGAGSDGEARALEKRGRRGVGTGERVEQRERGASSSAAVRQRGRKRGESGGPGCGGATRRGGAVGPSPDRRTALGSGPSAALAGDVRRARTCRPDRAGREGADKWATAQCRAAVSLTGGAGLSAGTVESAGARGPAREESGVAEPR